MTEEKKNQKLPCEICGKEVARVKLKTHLLYHEKRFTCVKCDTKFEVGLFNIKSSSKHSVKQTLSPRFMMTKLIWGKAKIEIILAMLGSHRVGFESHSLNLGS